VNADFVGSLERCCQYHTQVHRSTWITPRLVRQLDRFRLDPERGVDVCVFELWEGDALAAAVFSFMCGRVFHDFTMCTLVRDNRSAGHLLTKAVGHLIGQAGYRCWYWGFKNEYISDYDGYGPHHLSREEFWDIWAPRPPPAGAYADPPGGAAALEQLVRAGAALVRPLERPAHAHAHAHPDPHPYPFL